MGSLTYSDARKVWIRDKFYPGITSDSPDSEMTVEISRGDDWYCSKYKKDKKTGVRYIPNESTKMVAEKYVSCARNFHFICRLIFYAC